MKYHVIAKNHPATLPSLIVLVQLGGNTHWFRDFSRGIDNVVSLNAVDWPHYKQDSTYTLETHFRSVYDACAYTDSHILTDPLRKAMRAAKHAAGSAGNAEGFKDTETALHKEFQEAGFTNGNLRNQPTYQAG